FSVANLDLSDFSLELRAADGELRLIPAMRLYEGSFTGEIGLDVRGETPAASVGAALGAVALGPLLEDLMNATYLSGKGNVDLALRSAGADSAALLRGLDGSGRVVLEDGVLQGVDVGNVLTQV